MVLNMQISACTTTIHLHLMCFAKSVFPYFTSSCACWSTKTTPCNGVTALDWKQKAWHWTPLNTYNCSAFAPQQWCKGVDECTVCQICQDKFLITIWQRPAFPMISSSAPISVKKKNNKTSQASWTLGKSEPNFLITFTLFNDGQFYIQYNL